jgi:AraC family transcriptional regulator
METLQSGALIMRSNNLESEDHVSRLSIRCVLNSYQYYRLGSHDHMIGPENYLVINKGQTYRTAFKAAHPVEMMLVAFQPGFAEQVLYSAVTPADILLDNPHEPNPLPVTFFEQAYPQDDYITRTFSFLKYYIDQDAGERLPVDMDALYTGLLMRLLHNHRDIYRTIEKLSPAKRSTRVELYRRLSLAKDYIDAHVHTDIPLELAAHEACLSKYHFLRMFREVYGQTPHRYIMHQRLRRAQFLLRSTSDSVSTICRTVGFEDPGSFGRLFRRTFGITPALYRSTATN